MFQFLSQKISTIFSAFSKKKSLAVNDITELSTKVREAFLAADVPFEAINAFLTEFESSLQEKKCPAGVKVDEYLTKMMYDRVVKFLGGTETGSCDIFQKKPIICMLAGLQGAGKTTTVAKLAHYAFRQASKKNINFKVMAGSIDFSRPAALEQLDILGLKNDFLIYKAKNHDPVIAAQEIVTYGMNQKIDMIIIDTAGRLHVEQQVLDELSSIQKNIQFTHTFLVLDGMIGQQSLQVAKQFHAAIKVTGGILTKLDSETRGGAAFAFRYVTNKPLCFIGTGEHIDDFALFRADRMATQLLGLGDLESLSERVDEKIKKSDQERLQQSFLDGKMNLQDFAEQLEMMGKIGSLQSVMKFLPGLGKLQMSNEQIEKAEQELKRFKAAISSMTVRERLQAKNFNKSRIERIAKGAGIKTTDVTLLLERFEQNQQFAKLLKKGKFF